MRTKKDKPTAPPLATTLRAALASDWRTLAALDTLAGASGSYARRLVHEALREIKAGGAVLEERVGRGGVEVRLSPATLPAPVPDDGDDAESENDPRACPECEEIHPADDRHDGPFTPNLRRPSPPVEVASAAPLQPTPALDSPAPPVGQAAPVEAPSRPVNALSAHLAAMGHVEEAREVAGLPARSREPGPSSRCAVCGAAYKRHDEGGATKHVPGTCAAFKALLRGRPRVAPVAPPLDAAPTAADVLAEIGTPLSRERLDAVRAWASEGATEPETSRGGSEDRNDASTTDDARQRERERLPGPSPRVDGQPGVSGEAADQAPPMARTPRSKRTAAPVHRVDVSGCRPPLCHADDIHEPSRIHGFARPLCETHRRWVEGAGGTLASAADMAALHPEETV